MIEQAKNVGIICNPIAGTLSEAKIITQVNQIGKKIQTHGPKVQIYYTERRGHATEIAASAKEKEHDLLISVGGDGTFGEIIKGLPLKEPDETKSQIIVAPICTGTFDLLGQDLLLPKNQPEEAIEELFTRGVLRNIDLGSINGERFVNLADVGASAKAVKAAQKSGRRGKGRYYLPGLIHGITYKGIYGKLSVNDKEVFDGYILQTWFENTPSLVFTKLRPEATCDDGELESESFFGRRGFNAAIPGLRAMKTPGKQFPGSHYSKGGKFILTLDESTAIQIDGTPLPDAHTIKVHVIPSAITILIPDNKTVTVFSQPPVRY